MNKHFSDKTTRKKFRTDPTADNLTKSEEDKIN